MRTALYATLYPAAAPYLPAWADSVRAQTDSGFDVWVGLDILDREVAEHLVGADLIDRWIPAAPGDTPTQVRQRVLAQMLDAYDAIVFVDSDDVLYPTRVAAARAALKEYDGVGCGQRLVDQKGQDLGATQTAAPDEEPGDVLPHSNIFGLSNTAYRTAVLCRCLPAPAETVALDWLLATRAWLQGARLGFDRTVRMAYRQHESNLTQLLPPFNPQQIASHTALVRRHHQSILSSTDGFLPERIDRVKKAAADVENFYQYVVMVPDQLAQYAALLNAHPPAPRWWTTVAYPPLAEMWQ